MTSQKLSKQNKNRLDFRRNPAQKKAEIPCKFSTFQEPFSFSKSPVSDIIEVAISEQTELIKSLRLIIDEKSSHEKALQEQVDYLTKKLFGSSSERRSDDIPGQQNLFDEAEIEQDPSLPEEETVIKEHTRKKKATHEDLFKGLKVEKVVIPLPEEEQICPVCGSMSAGNWNSFLPPVK